MTPHLPLVYIAGPITIPDPIRNTRDAISVAEHLYTSNICVPLIPHTNLLWHLVFPHDNAYWYKYDLYLLVKCDAVLRLDGESAGADAELEVAADCNIPIFEWGNDRRDTKTRPMFLDWCDQHRQGQPLI